MQKEKKAEHKTTVVLNAETVKMLDSVPITFEEKSNRSRKLQKIVEDWLSEHKK